MPLRALTHSGTFHADEVTGFAVLRLAEPGLGPPRFARSRDAAVIAGAEIVFDVGGIYDPARGRYDHHMSDGPRRADGTPYSSAGLIWRDFGRRALATVVGEEARPWIEELWSLMDRTVFLPVDRVDNGIGQVDPLALASLVDEMNPRWDETGADEDAAFLAAADLAEGVLRRRALHLLSELKARDAVLEAAARSPDPRLIELPGNMPWERAVFEAGLPALLVVYPDKAGRWRLDCVRPEPGAFAQRLPLPAPWAGLRDAELEEATGVDGALFVHHARFTAGARTRAAVLELARLALLAGEAPADGEDDPAAPRLAAPPPPR